MWGWRVVKTNTVGGLIYFKMAPNVHLTKRNGQKSPADDDTIQDEM